MSITIVPFHPLFGSGRIDVHHVLGKNYGGIISFDFNVSYSQRGPNIIEKEGFGAALSARRFFSNGDNIRPYIALQGGFLNTHYTYQIEQMGWVPIEEDGMIYYIPGIVESNGIQRIQNPHTTTTIGFERHPFKGVFAFEIFVGVGYQWSIINTETSIRKFTNTGSTSPYFSGLRFVGGIKLGVFIY